MDRQQTTKQWTQERETEARRALRVRVLAEQNAQARADGLSIRWGV